jgi:hypothetical protein
MKFFFPQLKKLCNILQTAPQASLILSDSNSLTQNTSEINLIYFFQILKPPWKNMKNSAINSFSQAEHNSERIEFQEQLEQ